MSEKAKDKDIGLFLYIGEWDAAKPSKVKNVYCYIELDKETKYPIAWEHEFNAIKAPRYNRNPGALFLIEVAKRDPNGKAVSLYLRDQEPAGFSEHPDLQPHILEWQARMKARRLAKVNIQDAKRDLVDEQIEPLRRAYFEMSPAQRKAFIAYLIMSIQKTPK